MSVFPHACRPSRRRTKLSQGILPVVSTGCCFCWLLFLLLVLSTGCCFYWLLFLLLVVSTASCFHWLSPTRATPAGNGLNSVKGPSLGRGWSRPESHPPLSPALPLSLSISLSLCPSLSLSLSLPRVEPLTQPGSLVSGAIRLWRFPPTTVDRNEKNGPRWKKCVVTRPCSTGVPYLKKKHPPRTLWYAYA